MNVLAFSTPLRPQWRWRIITFAGDVVQESTESFPTIGRAIAEGAKRLQRMDATDNSVRPSPYSRSTSHLRAR